MLTATTALLVGLAGLLLGVGLGCTGVGGVLLVPFLAYALGMPVHAAVAAALYSYLLSGLLAVLLYARRGSIAWGMAGWLSAAALPGAYLGAQAAAWLSGRVLQGLIALVLLVAGVQALARRHAAAEGAPALHRGVLLGVGFLTGFVSAMVGAGGALLLVPLLLALRQPLLLSVGLGQLIQVPISAVASWANLRAGQLDVATGTLLAVALGSGIAVGTPLAHGLPQRTLRQLLGLAMLASGAAVAVRLLLAGNG
ncbi:MAG: sulfite exporter TauE/SafE family protein [Myxococcaceae bacterium]